MTPSCLALCYLWLIDLPVIKIAAFSLAALAVGNLLMTIVDRPLPSSFISGYIGGIILVVVWFTALNYLARRQAD